MLSNKCAHKYPDGTPALSIIDKQRLNMVYPKKVNVYCDVCNEIMRMKEKDLPKELRNA